MADNAVTNTGAPKDEPFVTATSSSNLSAERVLTGTTNQITVTDNGANSTAVLSFSSPTSSINNPPYAMVFDEATTNLVTNPSFEVDVSGWTATTEATRTRVTSQKYTGDASLEVVVSGATALGRGVESSSISVTGSANYIFSVWLKGASGSEGVTMSIVGTTTTTNAVEPLTTSWRRYSIRRTMAGGDTSVTLRIVTTGITNPTFYVDGVQFEQKDTSSYSEMFPSTYCDGSLGSGYSWSGTAHASTSSRTTGLKVLAPIAAGSLSPWAISPNGGIITPRLEFTAELGGPISTLFGAANGSIPRSPFYFNGGYSTITGGVGENLGYGNSSSLVAINNTGDGTALYVKSASTVDAGMIMDAPSMTSGTIFGLYAPSDLTNFSGSFLKFADKSGANTYDFKRDIFYIGSAALPYSHTLLGIGGGGYATSTTAKTGTVSGSTTTITGTGTSFTTEFSVGDIIVAASQRILITAIASNTSLTVLSAPTPAWSGASIAKLDTQYKPFFLSFAGPQGDHYVYDFIDKQNTIFFTEGDRPKIVRHSRASGTGTISSSGTTVTGSGTSFTTELSIGDIIFASNQQQVVMNVASNTSLTTRTAFSPVISAGTSFTYINTQTGSGSTNVPNPPTPTSATSGVYFVTEEARETSSAGPSATLTETSLFTTTPTIPGGRLGTTSALRATLTGTMTPGAAGTLILRAKMGGTTILTTTATAALAANAHSWVMRVHVANNASASAQNCALEFVAQDQTAGTIINRVISATATIDTTLDRTFDVSADFDTTAGTMSCNNKLLEVI